MSNRRVWKTGHGELIRIKDMTDDHLANTLRYLDRYAATAKELAIMQALRLISCLRGEMALESAEDALDTMYEEDPISFLSDPSMYDDLVSEADRRKLIWQRPVGKKPEKVHRMPTVFTSMLPDKI